MLGQNTTGAATGAENEALNNSEGIHPNEAQQEENAFREQFTNVALYGTEQLYLGGMDTIRGFRSGGLADDRGLYSRNELAWVNVPAWHDGRVEPYVFLDAGKVSLVATPGFPTLAGIGAGLRAQWQWHSQQLSGEALVGHQLCRPSEIGPRATLVMGTINYAF